MKRKWKPYAAELYRKYYAMTVSFQEESYDKVPAVLESKGKAALKALRRNKLSRSGILIELFQAKETDSVKILMRICQQIWKRKQ